MDLSILSALFDEGTFNITSNSGFTASFRGFKVKGSSVAALPIADIDIYLDFPNDVSADFERFSVEMKQKYGNIPTSLKGNSLGVLADVGDGIEKISYFFDELSGFLAQHNAQPTDIPSEPSTVQASPQKQNSFTSGTPFAPASSNPYGTATKAAAMHENYLLGLLGSVVGALLGAAVWVLIGMLGYVSVLGGMCIVFGAIGGYWLLAKDFSKVGAIIICVVCVLAVAFGCYATSIGSIMAVMDLSLSESISMFPMLMSLSHDFKVSFIKDLVFGYIFSIIAAVAVIGKAMR